MKLSTTEFKEQYSILSNKIATLYSKWSDIVPALKPMNCLKEYLNDPLGIVDLIENMIIMRSP